jgi:hypothetical protein
MAGERVRWMRWWCGGVAALWRGRGALLHHAWTQTSLVAWRAA